MKAIKKVFKEPVFLFFLIGALLFIVYTRATDYMGQKNRQIFISQTQIALLEETFRKTWNRSPSENELSAQIENLVKDEIFSKAAVDMGLDKTDPAIKRRLRQIMEMMMDDYATIYPAENQLRTYLSENPEKFRRDSRISFRHMHFSVEDKEQAIHSLDRLNGGNPLDENYTVGLLLIPDQFEDESEREIERLFGNAFTRDLFALEPGEWTGPVESSYGWHLVQVSQRTEGEVPDLNEIWDMVEREWSVERKKEKKEEQYKAMRDQYKVTIEQ
jgi:PPIC-type PPIASE domain